MKARTISGGAIERTFIVTIINESGWRIEEANLTEEDYGSGELGRYGVDSSEDYEVFTTSKYSYTSNVWDLEIGDIVEIDTDIKLMRVA